MQNEGDVVCEPAIPTVTILRDNIKKCLTLVVLQIRNIGTN